MDHGWLVLGLANGNQIIELEGFKVKHLLSLYINRFHGGDYDVQ